MSKGKKQIEFRIMNEGGIVMLRKFAAVTLLVSACVFNLTGCGIDMIHGIVREYEEHKEGIKRELQELKENIKCEMDEILLSLSKCSLTEDDELKGRRRLGADDYVGSYEADYTRFSGEEYIFGDTSVSRENGNTLKTIYSLNVQSGTAKLYWLKSTDEHIVCGDREEYVIAEATADDTYEFTIGAGDNYIVFEGNDFTGNLAVKVE